MSKKRFLLPAALLTACLLFAGLFFLPKLPSIKFQALTEQLFVEEMTGNTLNMHYTLADPAAFDIEYEAVLPAYSKENTQNSHIALKSYLQELDKINTQSLSEEELYTYNLLYSYLETIDALNQYTYYDEPLSPSSGIQSQLPILLAEYTFRSVRDVEDYLDILAQTGAYFDSLLTFETEKKAEGLLMPAGSLNDVIEQCLTILTENALKNREHFLQITFEERLQQLREKQVISAQEEEAFILENDTLLMSVMLPAYQRLAVGLKNLSDASIPLEGLASKPEGREYYEALVRSETGSYLSMQEIYDLLTEHTRSEYAQLEALLQDFDFAYLTEEAYEELYELFPFSDCSEMLIDLQERMQGDFPAFPESADVSINPSAPGDTTASSMQPNGSLPIIHVKEVAECLEDYCAPAFYLTPPFDDTYENCIYINTKTTQSPIDLYTTLAHEGFPGHLYQTVYSNQLLATQTCGKTRQLLWYGGYLEGWALYVEFLSYDYASDIMEELGEPEYAELIQIEKHNRSLLLCLYSLLDVLIHYDNCSYQDTAELLGKFGITNSASVTAIYEYIVEEPANYLKYYLGYLEILRLQEKCRAKWQEDYSDYRFHKFFLDYGPADFKTLSGMIETEKIKH